MDPNETLRQIREAVFAIAVARDYAGRNQACAVFVEHFTALDGWLKNGRPLPDDWQDYIEEKGSYGSGTIDRTPEVGL